MQIYLAKPGGQKEGPFTLDQINRDLAAKKLSGNDYWAWYEGLPSWMPLHSLPGVTGKAAAVVPAAAQQPVQASAPPKAVQAPAPKAATPAAAAAAAVAAEPAQKPAAPPKPVEVEATKPVPATPAPAPELAAPATPAPAPELVDPAAPLKTAPSGLPFSALEQIFIFTTGEGKSVFESQLANQKLADTVGEEPGMIREQVQVNVVGRVDAGVEMMHDGSVPDKAWRAIAAIKPDVAEQAKAGVYQFCVRTLLAETNDVITLLLFYRKQG